MPVLVIHSAIFSFVTKLHDCLINYSGGYDQVRYKSSNLRSSATKEAMPSPLKVEKLALTVIEVFGMACIIARLFYLSRDDPAKVSGAFEFRDGSITERSKRTFVSAQPISLVLGTTAGVIAASVAGWNDSNWTTLGAWVRNPSFMFIRLQETLYSSLTID